MAKKSKRSKRLKKLAKVLGAGLAIAGLGRAFANRNATPSTNAAAVKAMTSDAAYSIPKGDESSFKVQDVKVNVPSNKSSFFESRMTPANRGVNYDNPSGTVGTNKKASIRSINAAKMAAPKNITGPFSYMNPYVEPDMYSMAAAKKGGRIVKTKSGGKALRGYGRAYKGGKK